MHPLCYGWGWSSGFGLMGSGGWNVGNGMMGWALATGMDVGFGPWRGALMFPMETVSLLMSRGCWFGGR
ncbi:hypothetical protein [Candidatus Hodgkinia cicadicola]|uniref:hypothetical protein n=1 Tax=Candidatus Hodgkinia cicadicola TaxID=573658 RepID=UPI0011BA7783